MIHVLGDKGYPLTEYLVTPLANPATEQELSFNSAHICTWTTVECCVGFAVYARESVQHYFILWGSIQYCAGEPSAM